MTSTLLVLLLSQAEGPDNPPDGAMEPPLSASSAEAMRANSPRARWAGLLLAMALLSTGCMSLTPPPGRGMYLRYTPREAAAPASSEGPGVEAPRALASLPEPEA